MDAGEILARAMTGPEKPEGWVVLPLLRNKLLWGMLGWTAGVILGLGLFVAIAAVVIPYNFEHGFGAALITTLILAMMLFIGIGSLWSLIIDINRLRSIRTYLIVITSTDFVKQEGKKIIQVPLMNVRHVTARGVPPPDRTPSKQSEISSIPGSGESTVGMLFGRAFFPNAQRWRRSRMRTPTSLAFIDTRTDDEVTVVTDSAYGDPFMIAALLKQYAASVQQLVK